MRKQIEGENEWTLFKDNWWEYLVYDDDGTYLAEVNVVWEDREWYWCGMGIKPEEGEFPEEIKTIEQAKAYALMLFKMR